MVGPWSTHRRHIVDTSSTHDRPMVDPWPTHGQPMVDPWSTHGRPLADPWSTHGRTMVDPWSTHGFCFFQPRLNSNDAMSTAGNSLLASVIPNAPCNLRQSFRAVVRLPWCSHRLKKSRRRTVPVNAHLGSSHMAPRMRGLSPLIGSSHVTTTAAASSTVTESKARC